MSTVTETAICGQRFQTPGGKWKECKKEEGHEGNHAFSIPRNYDLPTVDEMEESFQIVENPNDARKLAPKKTPGREKQERSDVLKWYDAQNAKLYDAWVKKGKPAEYENSPLGKVHVPKGKVDGTKFLIRSSGQFLDHGIQFGDDGVKDRGGRYVVSWRCIDKRERKSNGNGQ